MVESLGEALEAVTWFSCPLWHVGPGLSMDGQEVLMFLRRKYFLALSAPPRSSRRPGCGFGLCLLVVVCVVVWLLLFSNVLTPLVNGKPSITIALPSFNGVTFANQSPGASGVLGRPSLSASFVNRVLSAYHSPAVGTGQALYDLSQRYGIDDVYALAFFMHESTFGTTGVARATLSLGNIRCTSGYQCIEGYRAYATWQAGYLDWYQLIKDGYVGGQVSSRCPCVTVEQIIPVYAPVADGNNEQAYIAAVLSAVAAWRAGRVVV